MSKGLKLGRAIGALFCGLVLVFSTAFADKKEQPKIGDEKERPKVGAESKPTIELKEKEAQLDAAVAPKKKRKRIPVERLGKHFGRVRNAGRFKVEMRTRQRGIDVYLINPRGNDPEITTSSVEGQLYLGKKEFNLKFWPVRNAKKFFANWPTALKTGDETELNISLVLLPTRKKVVGGPVIYKMKKYY